jgi:hypothetical protein
MKTNLTLLKWLLAAGIGLLAAGCGSRSQETVENVTALLSRKEKAIQTIDKIKSEKELGLVEYEIRKVVKAKESRGFIFHKNKAIICACKAYLKAGIDLSGFDPMADVTIDPDETMITITLPSPTLLSLNMPIDSVDVLYEKAVNTKEFTVGEVNAFLQQGETQIRESVKDLGILDDAKSNARRFFEPLFKHLGFLSVQVNFKEEKTN